LSRKSDRIGGTGLRLGGRTDDQSSYEGTDGNETRTMA
jgi:hypothetical protein